MPRVNLHSAGRAEQACLRDSRFRQPRGTPFIVQRWFVLSYRPMLLTGLVAGCLFVALVTGDWWWFSRPNASAGRYGCPVARVEDTLPIESNWTPASRFDPNGLL